MKRLSKVILFHVLCIGPILCQVTFNEDAYILYGPQHGLSQNSVTNILQDRYGFLWIGTLSGLNRFNGQKFQTFRFQQNNRNSLPDDKILDLIECYQGDIWIATSNGLGRWSSRDTSTPIMHRYYHNFNDPRSLVSNFIFKIFQDTQNVIWIAAAGGLHRYNPNRDDFDRIGQNLNSPLTLSGNGIFEIGEDHHGKLWISTNRGVTVFSADRSKSYQHLQQYPDTLQRYEPSTLEEIQNVLVQNHFVGCTIIKSEGSRSVIFQIIEPTELLLTSIGEIGDLGWLKFGEIRSGDKTIWSMQSSVHRHAGGDARNRIAIDFLDLPPGSYELIYNQVGDENTKNLVERPLFPNQIQGIQLAKITPEFKNAITARFADLDNTYLFPTNHIRKYLFDSRGRMWVATHGKGTLLFQEPPIDPYQNKTKRLRPQYFPPSSNIGRFPQDLFEDMNGNIWMSSEIGLTLLEQGTEYIDPNHFLSKFNSNSIEMTAIHRGQDGVLWLGTALRGLAKWSPFEINLKHEMLNAKPKNTGPDNNVYSFLQGQRNTYWIGTRRGLALYDLDRQQRVDLTGSFAKHPLFHELPISSIHAQGNGGLWVGTDWGLFSVETSINLDEKEIVSVDITALAAISLQDFFGKTNPSITFIESDPNGGLWLGTKHSGSQYFIHSEDKKLRPYVSWEANSVQTLLDKKHVSTVYRDTTGLLWLGTYGHGLYRFKSKERTTKHMKHAAGISNGLSHSFVTCFLEDQKNGMWIGTYGGGISRLLNDDTTWQHFSVDDGLPDNVIYGLIDDNKGTIWASSNGGLARIYYEAGSIDIKKYNLDHGIQAMEFHRGSYFKNQEGRLFFGGVNGFNHFIPNRASKNYLAAPRLLKLHTFGEEITLEKPLFSLEKLSLGPNTSSFQLEFSSVDFSTRAPYFFRLLGLDDTWQQSELPLSSVYTKLPPGDYIFEVKHNIRKAYGNEEVRRLPIRIIPHFLQSIWFKTLSACLLILLIFILYRWRIWFIVNGKKLQQQFMHDLIDRIEEERRRISSNIHDSIGQELSLVIGNLRLKARDSPQNLAADLTNLSNQVAGTLQDVRDVCHNLRLHQLDELGLHEALINLKRKVENLSDICVFLEWPEELRRLSPNQEIHLYRITQEALNNILRHADAAIVRISLQASCQSFQYIISDNGKGIIDFNEFQKGLGLRIMEERIGILMGSLEIKTAPNIGTLLTFKFPA